VPEYYKLPGFISPSMGMKFSDVPNGLGALSKMSPLGILQIVIFAGLVELNIYNEQINGEPGNYGAGFLGARSVGFMANIADPVKRKEKLNAELANGRLAMMAIIGMFFQDGLTGSAWGDWALYTDSPLRASDSPTALRAGPKILEGTGGPNPQDFWDPAGLAKGKTDEQLLHWRAVELKHGRVSMLACLGWFHNAAGWHPIGDFANGVRVSDDPLIAVTQMPMGGIWQVVFTIMCFEWMWTVPCPPPPEKPWDVLGWTDLIVDENDADWKYNQVKELNNGRLAMLGIMGLIVQDATTGDYFPGIAQKCFGNIDCADDNFQKIFPSVPFSMPPLYPGQMYSVFPITNMGI